MALSASTIAWDLIQGQFPSYGPRYADITRPGDSIERFLYEGHRGGRVQVTARRYFDRQSDALGFAAVCTALQGTSIILQDRLNSRWIPVFLHQLTFEPLKRIGSSNGRDWAVVATLDIQRTA